MRSRTIRALAVWALATVSAVAGTLSAATDVVVYGGTPAGVMAAAAAAREGASVVLLEPGQRLGGMVSNGLGATDVGNASTVGGDTLGFFVALGKHYGIDGPTWKHEPHVAEAQFKRVLADAGVHVRYGAPLRERTGVTRAGPRIESITTTSGEVFAGKVFVDASYEGDLLAQAGVKYTVGRESSKTYGEERAGVRPPVKFGHPGSARDADGNLLPDIVEPQGNVGDADNRIMAYTFRLCLTRNPNNRVTFTKPDGYDPRRYELLLIELARKPAAEFGDYVRLNELPNGKVDANNRPGVIVSTNLHNGSWGWPDGSYADRERIWKEHERYLRGFYWFMQSDPRVPERIRSEAREWGLAKDEFTDTGNWPPQIYVRVARRMVGAHVMTAHDLTTDVTKPDSVGMGSYMLDSHRTARVVLPDGDVGTEGGVGGRTKPYQIAYRSLTPRRDECENLLVPVCLSTSAVALCSIRMEPVYMILGQSAGTAAGMAAKTGVAVQDVPYEALRSKLLAAKQVLALQEKAAAPDPAPAAAPAPAPALAPAAPAGVSIPGIKVSPPGLTTLDGFSPAFDRYGQFMHRDWPGKVTTDDDLRARVDAESKDLAAHPGPKDWNQYGGWQSGPTLEATGFFRTAKHGGRWWLVDPAGKLFFSIGVNCVRKGDPTPIAGREEMFSEVPGNAPAFAPFVVTDVTAIKGAFAGKTPRSFDFASANLLRKYGPDWDAITSELAHRRLRSWGFNTIGNWSHEPMYQLRRTPYTRGLRVPAVALKLANGAVKDPFDPAFEQNVAATIDAEKGKSNGDPWCIGYFVDNEVPWGKPGSVGEATLRAAASQPAKQALLKHLRERYTTISGLNSAWETDFADWDALAASTDVPPRAADDLAAFHLAFADQYYRTVKAGFVRSGTKQLYLGSRIHGRQDAIIEIASRHCDVTSVNGYRLNVDVYAKLDAPMLVGEFSFGATDRGMFYAGQAAAPSQAARGERFEAFVRSARLHPSFVGCHWFQYQDQPASGRTREGENGEYGLVDIVDEPATPLIRASRRMADKVYTLSTEQP